jgi:hypothetical protein
MIDLTRIASHKLRAEPYSWAEINNLFSPKAAAALADSFPVDHFKIVEGYGGEKDYRYEARALIAMSSAGLSYPEGLSREWLSLGFDFLSPAYRVSMSLLTEYDLTTAPMEVNVFHYGAGAMLGPHPDLDDKLVTHVIYFNRTWNRADGGCLKILRSSDPDDVAVEILPVVGNSTVLVRSDHSWHAVSPVVGNCRTSRRSLTVTFYREGSVSSMWPANDITPLHTYKDMEIEKRRRKSVWRSRLLGFVNKPGTH